MMGGGFVALRWVAPDQLGAWQFAVLFEQLLHILRLGVPNAVNRQVPLFLGRHRRTDAVEVFQVGMTYMLGCALLLSLAVIVSLLFIPSSPYAQREALVALVVSAPLNIMVALLEGLMRGAQTLRRLAYCYLLSAPIAVTLLILPAEYGFRGYLARLVVLSALQVAMFCILAPVPLRLKWSSSGLMQLIKTGFPLYVWNYLSTLSTSVLPWYIGLTGGAVMLGYFGPANSLLAVLSLVPAAFSAYLAPSQNFALGEGKSARFLVSRLKQVFLITLVITTLTSVVGGVLFTQVVKLWLPQFEPITSVVPIVAAIGCIRCYIILQGSIGLFLDRWMIRVNLTFLIATRTVGIVVLVCSASTSFVEILWVWFSAEAVYLIFQWRQLDVYVRRVERQTPAACTLG